MENIALALSGGGFRAAAFSLGTLSYLNKLEYNNASLLHNVKFIGSASGGSITNLAYSLNLSQDKDFHAFYFHLLESMEGETLIAGVFRILKDNSYWKSRPGKNRNLINAFAIAYDKMLFSESEFGMLNNFGTNTANNRHIEQVCVNSTEFANGLSFRFQSTHKNPNVKRGLLGNHFINIGDDTVANKLKLGDILAASSCFPGGFEPLIYPHDFMHESLTVPQLKDALNYRDNPFTSEENTEDIGQSQGSKKDNEFGLMDGGIADNQAIGSLHLAGKRKNSKPFDLLLITDVTSYFINAYSTPEPIKVPFGNYSIRQIGITIALLFALFTTVAAGAIVLKMNVLMTVMLGLAVAAPLCLIAPKLKYFFKQKTTEADGTWKIIILNYGRYFLQLPLNTILMMLVIRLKSVFLMTSDIYLKQIRRNYYQQLYADTSSPEIVVSNAIYDLSKVKEKVATKKLAEDVKDELGYDPENPDSKLKKSDPLPSPEIRYVAEEARKAATTLWFDKYQREAKLKEIIVATGQFTTCYNLLKYLQKRKPLPNDNIVALESVMHLLETDWEKFKADPFWLFNQEEAKRGNYKKIVITNSGNGHKVTQVNSPEI